MKSSDLSYQIDQALSHVHTAWTPERQAAVAANIRRRRRTRRRVWQVSCLPVAALCGLTLWWVAGEASRRLLSAPEQPLAHLTHINDEQTTMLPDGTVLTYLHKAADVDIAELSTKARHVTFNGGTVRFAVTTDLVRPFVVHARGLLVEVMGTVFVLRDLDDEIETTVEEGVVRVIGPEGERELRADERARIRTTRNGPAPAPITQPRAASERAAGTNAHPRWRSLAQAGRYDEAYVALHRAGTRAVPDEAAALLEAGDVARLSRHPNEAVAPISRMLAKFPHDPRAALAAFTLGLVYLQELGRAADAARAFAHARKLEPQGVMAEDALARQVEALFRAGEPEQARVVAQDYMRLYPQGRRLQAVRRYGGLD